MSSGSSWAAGRWSTRSCWTGAGGGRTSITIRWLGPFRPEGKIRDNPRVPRRAPRAMPDERWNELFAGLRSDRDRAILALGISTGARASELLGVRGCDLDWGEQLVRVCLEGLRGGAVASGQP